MEEIAATLGKLTPYIEESARRIGLDPVPDARRVRPLIGLRSDDPIPADLGKQLALAGARVSKHGNSIRVSPKLYNTRAECDRLFEAQRRVL